MSAWARSEVGGERVRKGLMGCGEVGVGWGRVGVGVGVG